MNGHTPKCNLLKLVNDRFVESAAEYAKMTGRPGDAEKYIALGSIIQRKVCQKLRETFIWEDRRFVDFDPFLYYSTNLLVQINAKKMQKVAHGYRKMLQHMRDNDLISISEPYCHDERRKKFCKSYTLNTNLLRQAIDTVSAVNLVTIDLPQDELDELEELAEEAKKTEWVEFNGLKMHFDIDGAMQCVTDDFTKCQKDKYAISPTKMKCALIAWMDKTRHHQSHVVDFRDFHFLTSMPKASLCHIFDEKGRRFHEIIDLPSGNILTTALSFYNSGDIPSSEYCDILRSIFKKEECGSTYDQFIQESGSKFPRKFIKKCFQVVINCSDRQMAAHERKSKAFYKNPSNIHLQTSKCVVDIYNWMMSKYPNFGEKLRNYDVVPSMNYKKEVKGTYYAFTYVEKNIIDGIQDNLKSVGSTIRIHDAVWGFEDFGKVSNLLKWEVKKLSTLDRIYLPRKSLVDISSNKVSKTNANVSRMRESRRVLVT